MNKKLLAMAVGAVILSAQVRAEGEAAPAGETTKTETVKTETTKTEAPAKEEKVAKTGTGKKKLKKKKKVEEKKETTESTTTTPAPEGDKK